MPRFEDIGGARVQDNVTGYVWEQNVIAQCSWNDLPEGILVPTLAEMKTLIDGQRAVPAEFAAAFGEGNAPIGWYWVHSIDPARENVWEAGPQTEQLAEDLSLEKPGHVSAWFNWQGNQPRNRRILQAFCRPIQRSL
jgi:hypothetical protein